LALTFVVQGAIVSLVCVSWDLLGG
jgi:hypothetical protein